jgi:hypothetical protein
MITTINKNVHNVPVRGDEPIFSLYLGRLCSLLSYLSTHGRGIG